MNRLLHKKLTAARRVNRVRSTVIGTSARPRLSVDVSLHHVSAQIIDDSKGTTLAAATSVGKKDLKGSLTEKAAAVGAEIGQKAKKAKVTKVAFDRRSRLYHGRIKALAEAARKEGLEF